MDERSNFEVEAFSSLQKLDFLQHLTLHAPQFRPWNREPGKVIPAADIPLFLSIVAELRQATLDKEFGRLLDRIYAKAAKSRDLALPIFLFYR